MADSRQPYRDDHSCDQGGGVGDFEAAALAALELPSTSGPSRPATGAAPVWLAGVHPYTHKTPSYVTHTPTQEEEKCHYFLLGSNGSVGGIYS